MQVKLKKNETFEKLLRRFKKRVEKDDNNLLFSKLSESKDDIIKTFRSNQEFVPKSVARQQKKADKLRKSKENGRNAKR